MGNFKIEDGRGRDLVIGKIERKEKRGQSKRVGTWKNLSKREKAIGCEVMERELILEKCKREEERELKFEKFEFRKI